MADNTILNAGTGGDVIASDDIASVKFQRIKLVHGGDGVNAGDVAVANALPVAPPINVATQIDTTTVALAVGATYNSPAFDTTVVGKYVTHFIFADVAGTHNYQESYDGATWRTVDSDPIAANTLFFEDHICAARYHRAQYVNGATIQVTFNHQLVCSFTGVAHEVGFRVGDNIVQGDKTTNTAAPSAEAHEVIGCIANAAAPSYTEGNVVLARVTLAGDTAITLDGEAVVLGAGAVNIGDVDVLTLPAIPTGTNVIGGVFGDVAHDAVDSGNPLSLGGIARTAFAAVSAALDRVKATFDLQGRQIVRINAMRGLRIKNPITLTNTTETTLLTAAASTFHDLTKVIVSNTSATAVRVDFRDTTAGTVMFSIYAPAGQTVGFTDSTDPIEQAAVNTNWTAQLSAAVTDVRIFAQAIRNI